MLGYFLFFSQSGRTGNFACTIEIKTLISFDTCGTQNMLVLPDGKGTKKLPSLRKLPFGQIYFDESGKALPNPRLK